MGKTSEAQLRAVKSYRKRNPEKSRSDSYHRTTRLFIRKHSTLEDLDELEAIIAERRKELEAGQ